MQVHIFKGTKGTLCDSHGLKEIESPERNHEFAGDGIRLRFVCGNCQETFDWIIQEDSNRGTYLFNLESS